MSKGLIVESGNAECIGMFISCVAMGILDYSSWCETFVEGVKCHQILLYVQTCISH